MAKIVEGQKAEWSAVIRCATAVMGNPHRVEGCFVLIEITRDDLQWKTDSDGDSWVETRCPACGITLYPRWQLASLPAK